MRLGMIAVRDALGSDVPDITDQEIRDALWHYYYDVAKSVGYLLNSRMPKEKKEKKKKKGGLSAFIGSSNIPISEPVPGPCAGFLGHLDTGGALQSNGEAVIYIHRLTLSKSLLIYITSR